MLSNTLPVNQSEFATTAFSKGEVIHNGDILESYPARKGFHAVFNPKAGNTKYVGPFKTRQEAYSIGADFGDFSRVVEVV